MYISEMMKFFFLNSFILFNFILLCMRTKILTLRRIFHCIHVVACILYICFLWFIIYFSAVHFFEVLLNLLKCLQCIKEGFRVHHWYKYKEHNFIDIFGMFDSALTAFFEIRILFLHQDFGQIWYSDYIRQIIRL